MPWSNAAAVSKKSRSGEPWGVRSCSKDKAPEPVGGSGGLYPLSDPPKKYTDKSPSVKGTLCQYRRKALRYTAAERMPSSPFSRLLLKGGKSLIMSLERSYRLAKGGVLTLLLPVSLAPTSGIGLIIF